MKLYYGNGEWLVEPLEGVFKPVVEEQLPSRARWPPHRLIEECPDDCGGIEYSIGLGD